MKTDVTAYPYADSRAAKMLSARLAAASAEQWMSTRKLAKLLQIKQPSVISHMSNGRLPIPVERAVPLALHLQMEAGLFLSAVLEQRFPSIDFSILTTCSDMLPYGREQDWVYQLSGILLEQLTRDQARVIGEVARDLKPLERWIEPAEVPYVRQLRELTCKDQFGLSKRDWANYLDKTNGDKP